jgi:hypothetical protein
LEEANPTRDDFEGYRRWWGVICRGTRNRGGTCAIQQRPSASREAAVERWNMRAESADLLARLTAAEREVLMLEQICSAYADDEDRYLKGDGEAFGSIPTEAGLAARLVRKRMKERDASLKSGG